MKIQFFLILSFIGSVVFGQQDIEQLKSINKEVWHPFTKAFETYDYSLFKSIHYKDLIRISGNSKRIQDLDTYMLSYEKNWNAPSKRKQSISFRFIERIVNADKASERGIYKLTVDLGTPNERSYYGKFHVLLRKENGIWKIAMDYDSDEGNTINEDSYSSAFTMNDFDKY